MIVNLYAKNNPNVLGTINTGGKVPSATGVGEPMLEAWLKANEETPIEDVTRLLETYYASWAGQDRYSQIDEAGVPNTLRVVETPAGVNLLQIIGGTMQIRDNGEWLDVEDGDVVSGEFLNVSSGAVEAFDTDDLRSLSDAAAFAHTVQV